MAWCVPLILGTVCWLLPVLKSFPAFSGLGTNITLLILIAGALLLAAYPPLTHAGYPSLYVQPLAWSLYSLMAFVFASRVWRANARSFSPSATDLGVQSGAGWLLATLLIKFVASLGALSTSRHDYMASSDLAVMSMLLLGFVVNNGLALGSTITAEFLRTPLPRPTIIGGFATYNISLAVWVAGALWCFPYPSSWGRFLLAAAAFVFFFATLDLLSRLRLFDVFYTYTQTRRQRMVKLGIGAATISLVLAALVVVVMSVWIAGTMGRAPVSLGPLLVHLIGISFPAFSALALFTPLLGPASLQGLRAFWAYTAYFCLVIWTIALVSLAPLKIVTKRHLWYESSLAGSLASLGLICFALWLAAAFRSPRHRPTV